MDNKKGVSIYLGILLLLLLSGCSSYQFGYGFSPIDYYYAFYGWIDFIIFFIIFSSAARIALEKQFGAETGGVKALYISLGTLLALTLTLWEMYQGKSLMDLGPSMLLLLLKLRTTIV